MTDRVGTQFLNLVSSAVNTVFPQFVSDFTHRSHSVDGTCKAVVCYGCISGFYWPHGLTVENNNNDH